MAAKGYNLSLLARNEIELYQVAEEISKIHSVKVLVFAVDVRFQNAVDLMFRNAVSLESVVTETVKQMGEISVLISNAGVNRRRSSLLASAKPWDEVVDTNLKARFDLKNFLKIMPVCTLRGWCCLQCKGMEVGIYSTFPA